MQLSQLTQDEWDFANWLLNIGHNRNINSNGTIPFDIDMRVPDPDAFNKPYLS